MALPCACTHRRTTVPASPECVRLSVLVEVRHKRWIESRSNGRFKSEAQVVRELIDRAIQLETDDDGNDG